MRRRDIRLAGALLIAFAFTAGIVVSKWFDSSAESAPQPVEECTVTTLLDGDYLPAAKKAIGKAGKSVFCILYLVSYNAKFEKNEVRDLMDSLIAAKKRGVEVSVILDRGKKYGTDKLDDKNDAAYKYLKDAGIGVRWESIDIQTHTKAIVIDREIAIVGSTNWTHYALTKNHEASVLVKSTKLAETILAGFTKIK